MYVHVEYNWFFLTFFFGRIAPALLRQASYGTIKIGIYQSLKRLFVERLEGQYRLILLWGNTQRNYWNHAYWEACVMGCLRVGDSYCKDKASSNWFGINPCRGDRWVRETCSLSFSLFVSKKKKRLLLITEGT